MTKPRDLTGQKFGRLTAIERAGTSKHGKVLWRCVCDCGKEREVVSINLVSGASKSCGCLNLESAYGKHEDLIGRRFGRLVVTARKIQKRKSETYGIWDCLCDCGNHSAVLTQDLKTGKSKSCGCLRKEWMTSHGKSRSREYHSWAYMIQRCTNTNNEEYHNYGGRGITVCVRWKNSFQDFYSDMGAIPSPKHSIDRIDVNKGYFKENCRWVTQKEQNRNRRNTLYINADGASIPATTLYEMEGRETVTYSTFYHRIKSGWDWKKALTTATMKGGRLCL